MTDLPEKKQALVLLAHGSRDVRWRRPFEALLATLAPGDGALVALGYLQFCGPTLEQALRSVHDLGATHARVVPLFLSGGGHLLRDVPEAVAAAAASVPGLTVRLTGAIGEEPEVADALAKACLRLWAAADPAPGNGCPPSE